MEEIVSIFKLREFILENPRKYTTPLLSGKFPLAKFISLVKDCPRNRVYFMVYKFNAHRDDKDKWVAPCLDAEEIVPYLFDKVELFGWEVKAIEYSESGIYSIDGGKDVCYMWLDPPDDNKERT